MTPAERLRAAAQLARETAEAATPGPWIQEGADYGRPSRNVRAQHQDGWPLQGVAYDIGRTADAAHIALWSPPVALKMAALLEHMASYWVVRPDDMPEHPALAVADALLQTQPVKP